MRRDRRLVNLFLSQYGDYPKRDYPEDSVRNKRAVEVIAEDRNGNTLAIEHTLIQPFIGERDDAQPFSQILEPLDRDASLAIPGYLMTLSLPVGIVPKGVDWKEVSAKVKEYVQNNKNLLPNGHSIHKIPNLPFDLSLMVNKVSMYDDYPGQILVGRYGMPETFESVIEKALSDKLPKLSEAQADRRVLLFEQNSIVQNPYDFSRAIESLQSRFSDLTNIDEVWVAHTPVWGTERIIWFFQVWPKNTDKRFKITE